MTEKQWYEDIPRVEMADKHVRAVMDSGAVIEGCLKYWNSRMVTVYMGSMVKGIYVLVSIDHRWQLMKGVKRLDLVWDERDWDRIDAKDLDCGDAVVANGRLYKVRAMGLQDEHPFVLADAPGRLSIDLRLVSCALRHRVQVPVKPGFYRDRNGCHWERPVVASDKPWYPVDWFARDTPEMSNKDMESRMPLIPVHFVDGRAPEPGDELASVMRITSKGVTFTTEAA